MYRSASSSANSASALRCQTVAACPVWRRASPGLVQSELRPWRLTQATMHSASTRARGRADHVCSAVGLRSSLGRSMSTRRGRFLDLPSPACSNMISVRQGKASGCSRTYTASRASRVELRQVGAARSNVAEVTDPLPALPLCLGFHALGPASRRLRLCRRPFLPDLRDPKADSAWIARPREPHGIARLKQAQHFQNLLARGRHDPVRWHI